MREKFVLSVLQDLQNGNINLSTALQQIKDSAYEDLHFAKVDHDRKYRTGFPEVIFSEGKTPEQIVKIASAISKRGDNVLATRISSEVIKTMAETFPQCELYQKAKIAFIRTHPIEATEMTIAVLSAGTSDLPVAEEAAVTAELMGNNVERIYDVGVAGMHRLLDQQDKLSQAHVIIVVAGMEGALASVLAGMVSAPVIAVPTSIGYGVNLKGITTLFSMLTGCSSGMSVVNIDNGFGAAFFAGTITEQMSKMKNTLNKGKKEFL